MKPRSTTRTCIRLIAEPGLTTEARRPGAAFNLLARVGSSSGSACSDGAGALIGGLPTARLAPAPRLTFR